MMRKTLWALSLLFILSGCSDGGEESGSRYDRMVNTTFNIEYSLNYDTPSINYPATYSQQSEPIVGIPAIPSTAFLQVAVEFWEELQNDPDNPDAGVSYRHYGTVYGGTRNHIPVAGQDDRYVLPGSMRLSRSKFKVVVFACYYRTSGPGFFGLEMIPAVPSISHLRYIYALQANQNTLSYNNAALAYEALSGTKDLDLTGYDEQSSVDVSFDMSISRALGKFTLIATDFGEYKNSVSAAEFEATKKPLEVKVEYGGETGTGVVPTNGFRGTYDALLQTFTGYRASVEMQKPVISEDGQEMILTFDYALAGIDNEPLKDVMITIYGPMNTKLRTLKISEIPIERNKETFFRAPFLFSTWENNGGTGTGGITIVDDFTDKGTPVVVP